MAIVKALKITLGVILIIIGIISGPIPIVQGWIFIVFGLLLIGVKKETIKKWVGKAKKWIKKWIVKVIFLIFISYLLTFDEIRRPLWEKLKGLIIQFFQYIKK